MEENEAVINYIKNIITKFPDYKLTNKDKRTISFGKKAEWITNKLLLKRFRKSKLHDQTRQDILDKVSLSIKENKPIYLIILFGGYKHFWNTSHPEVDWAELFNLRFMSEYIAPILAVHPPGVILDYESEDVIIPLMDNYPEETLDIYATSFKRLIEIYSKCLPNEFKINYVRSQDQYNTTKLFERIKELLPKKLEDWKKLSSEEILQRLHRSPRSIMWKGKMDWTKLSEQEKQEKIQMSKIINETYYDADFEFRGNYFTGDNHIPIVLSWGLTSENFANWLTLGSTHASSVDFWIGRGILESRNGEFIPRVVSQTQYSSIKNKLQIFETNLLTLKNFKNIEVYEGELNF